MFVYICLYFAYTFSIIFAPFTYLRLLSYFCLKCQTLYVCTFTTILHEILCALTPQIVTCHLSYGYLETFWIIFYNQFNLQKMILFSSCSLETLLYCLQTLLQLTGYYSRSCHQTIVLLESALLSITPLYSALFLP